MFPCAACKAGSGHCDEHPQRTCCTCGMTYTDDSDWSGPAHTERDCIREMGRLLAETLGENWLRERLARSEKET